MTSHRGDYGARTAANVAYRTRLRSAALPLQSTGHQLEMNKVNPVKTAHQWNIIQLHRIISRRSYQLRVITTYHGHDANTGQAVERFNYNSPA